MNEHPFEIEIRALEAEIERLKETNLDLQRECTEKDAEIERLNAEVGEQRKTAESVRKLYEGLPERYDRLDEEYAELKALCTRAADALEAWHADSELTFDSLRKEEELIAELRKAAE